MPNGNVTAMTDYHGNTTNYAYDALGQLLELTAPGGKLWEFSYTDSGRPSVVVMPNGMVKQMAYDARGRMEQMALLAAAGGAVVEQYDYTLDANGTITRVMAQCR